MSQLRCPFASPFASSHLARKATQDAVLRGVRPMTLCVAPHHSLRSLACVRFDLPSSLHPAFSPPGSRWLLRGGRA